MQTERLLYRNIDESLGVFFSRDDVLGATELLSVAEQMLRSSRSDFDDNSELFDVLLAEIYVNRGYIYMAAEDFPAARRELERALELSSQVIELTDDSALQATSRRIAADSILYLARFRGLAFQMTQGRRLRSYAESAYELQPSNERNVLTLAVYLISIPGFAGRDLNRAISIIERQLPNLTGVFEFRYLVWLGIAHSLQNDPQTASDLFERAETIIPGSNWVRELRAEL